MLEVQEQEWSIKEWWSEVVLPEDGEVVMIVPEKYTIRQIVSPVSVGSKRQCQTTLVKKKEMFA